MKKGYSLNELMITVVIVGVLAVIAVPQYFKVAERSRAEEGKIALLNLRASQLRFYADNNSFTNDIGKLDLGPVGFKYFSGFKALNPGDKTGTNILGSIKRDKTLFSGPAEYTLEVQVDGKIICTTSADACAKSGVIYQE